VRGWAVGLDWGLQKAVCDPNGCDKLGLTSVRNDLKVRYLGHKSNTRAP
jgi:hypothetical protein